MPSASSSEKRAIQRSSIFTEYLDALARELRFDVPLSRRVRREVEDHLWETIANEPNTDPIEAQRCAVARFGDPRKIACQYAASWFRRQTRRGGVITILALTGTYFGMKGRGAWYGFMQWGLSDHLKDLVATWIAIDLNAFRMALAIGIIGLGYIASRRAPMSFGPGYRRQVKGCVALCAATAVALLVSVVTDIVITGLRLYETRLPAAALVPVLSIAVEVALVSMLIAHIRATIRRIAFASSLLM
jgi:hypothetical protein